MLPRERVIQVIQHQKPDRIPVYGWVVANLHDPITEAFGSVANFEDRYEFDFAHIFGGPQSWDPEKVGQLQAAVGGAITPEHVEDIPWTDPDDEAAYDDIRAQVKHHKQDRGRFVYVQTPGIFEGLNGLFGIENHLAYLLMYYDEIKKVYQRQAEWNRAFAMNCLDLGVDMIHVSDDWGSQINLMFSQDSFHNQIIPYHKITCDAVKACGGYLSLHSDGNINGAIDGILELGYDVVHPWQESAGMSLESFKQNYRDKFSVMGGLDVQDTIGFGNYDRLKAEIERVLRMFPDGGLLYCTTHFVQDHCSIEELTFAYDHIYALVRELANK